MQQKTNVCGVISLNLSIFSLLFSTCAGAGIILAIPAFILGIVGARKKNMGTGAAISGIIISIFAGLIAIVSFLFIGLTGLTTEAFLEML